MSFEKNTWLEACFVRPGFRISLVLMALVSVEFAHAATSCVKSKGFREIVYGKLKTHDVELCVRHPIYDFVSARCLQKQGCEAVRKYRGAGDSPEDISSTGSPSHRKCRRIGGKPSLIEYQDGTRWIEAGICQFSDGSVISVDNRL
ncbi:MAG: hypothetical protein KGQ59_03850 [Bdellovibrionales bacterium]|nr:hypothetical protein [Bdellovibrionales bacterium]